MRDCYVASDMVINSPNEVNRTIYVDNIICVSVCGIRQLNPHVDT